MNKTLNSIKKLIEKSDSILIGAGSGLSTAAGIDYSGKEFKEKFKEFIDKYGFTDLYTSSFYEFDSQEEYWAYFAKHISFANLHREACQLYKDILALVKDRNYFVITTNVDDQFYKAGFNPKKIFRVQGSYRYIQCSYGCHDTLYDDKEMVEEMLKNTDKDLKIKSNLVPICPVCGEEMEPNLRKDEYFVEDDLWHKQSEAYRNFIRENRDKNVLLLEFGVGFNTPGIIRFPFEKMTSENKNWKLIRFNKDVKKFYDIDEARIVNITGDIKKIFKEEE